MIDLILMLNLFGFSAGKPATLAQVQPCVWPNRCVRQQLLPELAQVQPCVWPNRCSAVSA